MSLLKGEGKKELKLSILPCAEICIFLFHQNLSNPLYHMRKLSLTGIKC